MKQVRIFRLLLVLTVTVAGACTPRPAEIVYGEDLCHFCSMAIVDNQFASQYVTAKGRAYKFDAIECMIKELAAKDKVEMAFVLVSNYTRPGELIDAMTAGFVVSEKVSSPMGANLLATEDRKSASVIVQESGGNIFDWAGICSKLKN